MRKPPHASFTRLNAPMAACLAILWVAWTAAGCPFSVREGGFIAPPYDVYHVYCFVRDDSPEKDKLTHLLDETSRSIFADSEVEVELINVDRQPAHDAVVHLESVGSVTLPVLILVSPQNQVLLLLDARLCRLSSKEILSALEKVVSSPKRDELKQHIVGEWCVVILGEGADPHENERARRCIAEASESMLGKVTAMGRVIDMPPFLLTVSREDPREQILLWGLGMSEGDAKRAYAAVLYGRGRRLGSVLEGEEISRDALVSLFSVLGTNCTCVSDVGWLRGVFVPLKWDEYIKMRTQERLGYDPENPMVRMLLPAPSGDVAGRGPLSGPGLGYTETILEFDEDAAGPPTVAMPIAKQQPVTKQEPATTLETRAGGTLLLVIVGMVLVAVVASAMLWLRKVRKV